MQHAQGNNGGKFVFRQLHDLHHTKHVLIIVLKVEHSQTLLRLL